MKLLISEPSGETQTVQVEKDRIRIGRDPRCDIAIDAKKFPKVSGLHAEVVLQDGRVWLIHRSKSNSTVVNGEAVQTPLQLNVGVKFQLGFTGPTIQLAAVPAIARKTILSAKASDFVAPEQLRSRRIDIGEGGVIGRVPLATYQLAHPLVSRRHASISRMGDKWLIVDEGSANGTFVDGERIRARTELQVGAVVDIGPFTLVFDGKSLASRSRANNVQIEVSDLSYVIPDAKSNRKIYLLNGISFDVDPGQFVAVLGPSGSGKSTLLKIVSGRNWPFSGSVSLNGRDLHAEFAAFKEDLVVVPQATAFHENLSVRQTLEYSAALRLQGDTSKHERETIVSESLAKVGLDERSETCVKNLSGGQLKRLGLACELISDPSLVFLDEVTSGLDEQADGEMMRLFRTLADTGKTLVCVTHNLSHVESNCHKVLILTVGGRVAFFGSPAETYQYFGVKNLADVYGMLETKSAGNWHAAYLAHRSMNKGDSVKIPRVTSESSPSQSLIRRIGLKPASQTWVLMSRYVSIWLGDLTALFALFGQAILVTALLCLVFSSIPDSSNPEDLMTRKSEIRNLLFLIGISCFWLGANNSAKEIVKERRIFERERSFNLVSESYWFSKVIVLSWIGFIQSSILTLTVVLCCGLPGNTLAYLACSLLLSLLGTSVGLAISANSKSEELSIALVPTVIIPQIILAGVVARLNDISELLAQGLTTSYWGQQLYENFVPEVDKFAADFQPSVLFCVSVLAGHLTVFLVVSWIGCRFMTFVRE